MQRIKRGHQIVVQQFPQIKGNPRFLFENPDTLVSCENDRNWKNYVELSEEILTKP